MGTDDAELVNTEWGRGVKFPSRLDGGNENSRELRLCGTWGVGGLRALEQRSGSAMGVLTEGTLGILQQQWAARAGEGGLWNAGEPRGDGSGAAAHNGMRLFKG